MDLSSDFSPENPFFLSKLLEVYNAFPKKEEFFKSFFKRLAGNEELQRMIEEGKSESEIRASWEEELTNYKAKRKKYLLYPDFE